MAAGISRGSKRLLGACLVCYFFVRISKNSFVPFSRSRAEPVASRLEEACRLQDVVASTAKVTNGN